MRRIEKLLRVALSVLFFLGNTRISAVSAANIQSFAGFESQNITLDESLWDLSGSEILGNYILLNGSNPSGRFILDITSIASAVDQGGLEIDFSAKAYIADELPDDLDEVNITVGFGTRSSSPDTSVSLPRGTENPDTEVSLSSNASIPVGTNYIFIDLTSLMHGTTNTSTVTALSLKIHDAQVPSIEYSLDPSTWTNKEVVVTVSASDADSGIEGIYNSDNEKVSSTDTYTVNKSVNGSWTFYALDNAGKTSESITVTIDKIDIDPPASPTILPNTTDWSGSGVSFSLSEVTTGTSPETRQYRLNGGEWQIYAETTTVEIEGITTIEARSIDAAGNDSVPTSAEIRIDKTAPSLTLTSSEHPQPLGGATITVDVSDSLSGLSVTKYAVGEQDAGFFTGESGTTFTGTTIELTQGGTYTFFAQDAVGNSVVKLVTVNTYPSMEEIAAQTLIEDVDAKLYFSVSDYETSVGSLAVSAVSADLDLFPTISTTNSEGVVELTLSPAENRNGSTTVTVTVEDAGGHSTSQIFNVIVDPANDEPAAFADIITTNEDTAIDIDALDNDSDPDTVRDGDSLTIVGLGTVENGTASIIESGTLIHFIPAADSILSSTFTYTIEDSYHVQSSSTITVNVTGVNDPPLLSDISDQIIDEDNSTGPLGFTATDVDGDSLTITATCSNEDIIPNGNITIVNLDDLNYTIAAHPLPEVSTWNSTLGVDEPVTITVTVDDGFVQTPNTFLITVRPVNDPPLAVDINKNTNEGTPVDIDVLASVNDPEGDTVTLTEVGVPSHGTAVIDEEDHIVTYTPTGDYNGLDTFSYTVSDGNKTSTADVIVTVNSVNDGPTAEDDTATVAEDGIVSITPLENDTDPDIATAGDHLVVSELSEGVNGTVVLAENKLSLTYTPDPNWFGTETLQYTIKDDSGATSSAEITITVTTVNDNPTAVDDENASTNEDVPVQIDVLFNDSDNDLLNGGDTLTIVSVTNGTIGTVEIVESGAYLEYSPLANLNGPDSFTYTIEDSKGIQSTATASVVVNPVNDKPVITPPANQTIEEGANTGSLSFTVSDVDSETLYVSAVSNDQAVIANNQITVLYSEGNNYTIEAKPLTNANTWTGSEHTPVNITITANDGALQSTSIFTITINPVNDKPSLISDTATTNEDTSVTINVLTNDSDIESDTLTVSEVGTPIHGTATITGSGTTVTYTPATNYNGSDSFSYTVSDGTETSSSSVSVSVNSVNDSPVANNDSATFNEDIVTTIDILVNDTDVDIATNPGFESLTIDPDSVSAPAHGSAVILDNKIVYTPDLDYNGTDSFTYAVRDLSGATSTGTATLTLKPINDFPTFSSLDAEYTLNEDNSITIHFNVADIETPTESLMLQVTSGNTAKVPNSRLVLGGLGDSNADTTLTITPVANVNGDVIITLRLGDGFVVTVATFTLHITPVNDNPSAKADSYPFNEDSSIPIDMDDLVANDTDIDNDTLSFVSFSAGSIIGDLAPVDEAAHTYTYTPPANFDQSTSFQYTMTDGTVTGTATVTLQANPSNDAPTIVMDGSNPTSADEDNNITIHFTVRDQETDASDLTVVAGSSNTDIVAPANVSINCLGTGVCTLIAQPSSNMNGAVTLTISVSDGVYLVPSSVALTFNALDDAPSAEDDAYTISTNGSQKLSPLDNDYDVDDHTFSITGFAVTSTVPDDLDERLTNNGDGTFTYIAPPHYTGTETFTYTITDSTAMTDTATVTLTVGSTDTAPSISEIADQFIMEDHPTGALAFTVTDVDGDEINFTTSSTHEEVVPNDASHITIDESEPAGSGNYTVVVTPEDNAYLSSTITITADDGIETTSVSFVVTVYPENDLPIAVTDEITTNEDTAVSFNPVSNDSDLESALTIVEMTNPSHGWLSFNGTNYTYTPYSNYYGSDSLTYTITDGESIATGTVNFTVVSINDAPVARSNWINLENTVGLDYLINVLGNDDSAGDSSETISIDSIVTPPSFGTAVIEDGKIRYTRTSAPSDSHDSFVYRIKDSNSTPLYATAYVYIAESWDPSINADDVWYAYNEDAPMFTIDLSITNGISGTYTLTLLDSSGMGVTNIADVHSDTITYTPNANAYGTETLRYKVTSDTDTNKSDTANITITLYPVNDLPIISSVSDQTINEDTSTSSLAVTISDVDDDVDDLDFEIYSGNQLLVSNPDIHVNRTGGDITFTISPIANRFGTAEITMLASDSVGYTSSTFDLNVTSVNDPPIALPYSISVIEDTPKTITVIPPHADIEDDPLELTIVTPPSYGTAVVNGDNTITYTPNANSNTADSFVYQLDDGHEGGTDQETVSITIVPVDDAPVISNLTYLHETMEDTAEDVTFTISDVDNAVGSLTLSYSSSNEALIPSSSLSTDPGTGAISLSILPVSNRSGESIITIHLSDGTLSTEQPFRLVVSPVNDLPVTNPDSATTNEDVAKLIDVVSNDSDVEDVTVTDVASVSSPSHGTVTNNRDGTVTYSPSSNWYGVDNFTYTVVDKNNGSRIGTVTVTVNPVNDAPNARTDTVNISEDVPVIIYPLANDSDVEGDSISLVSFTQPTKGTVADNLDGTLTYTPVLDLYGNYPFTYTITDGSLLSTGTVNINITSINDAPRLTTSVTPIWTMNEDTPTSFPINIYDPETASDNLVIKITSSNQTILPDTSIQLQGSGQDKTLRLIPNLNQFGTLDIQIEATDGELTTTEIFPVQVLSVNDLPTISNVTDKSITEDSVSPAYAFTVSDIETTATDLTMTFTTANGTLVPADQVVITHTGGGNRTVQITPTHNLVGTSQITLTVHDADGGTASDSFILTVTSVNDPPVAKADSTTVNEDSSVSIDVLGNDTDVDLDNEGDDLTITSSSGVDNGTVTIAEGSKSLTFTPNANWNGTEVFTYSIRDTAGSTSSASVTVIVNPVNDAPVATDDSATTPEDTNVSINVLANDTDIDLSRGNGHLDCALGWRIHSWNDHHRGRQKIHPLLSRS